MQDETFDKFSKRLLPAKTGGGFRMEGQWIWGGSPIVGDEGKYHLYASMWPKVFPFNPNWISNSRIVHAIADEPEGPYEYCDDVLPSRGGDYWDATATHNPSICRHGDQYVLFYMGTQISVQHHPTGESPTLNLAGYNQARGNQRIGVATSTSPYGPWTRYDKPILDVRLGHWDSLMTTNPAPWIFEDGSALLLYKSMPALDTPWSAYGVAMAEHYLGKYRRTLDKPILDPSNDISYEDAVIWQEQGLFYMLFKDRTGSLCGEKDAGCYISSIDGENWSMDKLEKAYSRKLLWENGRATVQGSLERPQVLLQDGKVTHLFFATADGPGGFDKARNTWNIAIKLRK